MVRARNKLSAIAVKRAGPGKHEDGGGLRLEKSHTAGKWIWRYSLAGRRREMGLGSIDDVSLAEARKARDKWAAVLAEGRDPISVRQEEVSSQVAVLNKDDPTFEQYTMTVFEARKAHLRGDGERGRWLSPLKHHLFPKIGKRRLSSLHQRDIADALRPIWRKKPATAEKAIRRCHIVFRHAKLTGLYADPFVVEAARHMLGEVRQETSHIASTPWQRIPDLYTALEGVVASRQCLRWLILTAVRGEPGRGARFSEIDGNVWTVPANRMKGLEGKVEDFRVPLSRAALALLDDIRAQASSEYLFHSNRTGFISENALLKILNTMGEKGRPHGFRSSFRSWVQDNEAATFEVAEMALAHKVGTRVERTYARSDLLEPRRRLMNAWGDFVTGVTSEKVLRFSDGKQR